MIKKKLLFLGPLLFLSSFLLAGQGGIDGNDYMWTQDFGLGNKTSYNWIDAKDGSAVFSDGIDNELSGAIPLPFTFNFYGKAQSDIYISANGYITFANQGVTTDPFGENVTIPSPVSAPDSMIAPYWGELSGRADQQANVYVKTVGSQPFRQYIIQWDLPDDTNSLEFQVILYEGSNNIKFQWAKMDVGSPGASETVGLQDTGTNALEYSFDNSPNTISEYSAILFHGEGVIGVDAAISPSSVSTSSSQEFTYVFNNISPTSTDILGKIDTVSITVPAAFSSIPTVTSIKINNGIAFIQNSASKPTDRGFATWRVNGSDIQIQTADFEVIDSLIVKFIQQTPDTTSTGNAFTSKYGAELDTNSVHQDATEDALGWTVDVTAAPGAVDYYTFSPVADTSLIAGNNLAFTVTAFDQANNPIANSDNVVFTASGSSTVTFSPNDTISFSASSTVVITVSDTISGSFILKAQKAADASVTGTSGLVTVNPDVASSITEISSNSAITVGATRRLQVRVDDPFGNTVSGASVTFAINSGSGSFSGANPATTDVNGIAFIDFTASTTSGGTDVIDVTSVPATAAQISLPVSADNVSYYTFTPSADSSITAGVNIGFALTAKDQYGNDVDNNGSVTLLGQGSTTESFSAGPYSFVGTSVINFTVSDQTAGSFTVVAQNTIDANITGQSGLVTVTPSVAAQFSIISSTANIVAGTNRLLQVGLEDQFGNRLNDGSTVTFTRFFGSGVFGGSSTANDAINANGVAEAIYTASNSSGADDSISVSFSAVLDTIVLPVISGALAEIRIQTTALSDGPELIDSTITADGSIAVFAVGYDASGNFLGLVSSTWTGSGVIGAGNLSPSNPTNNILFTATNSGAGKLTATDAAGGIIDAISGTITINAGATVSVLIMDTPGGTGTEITTPSLTTGDVLNLYANGFDADANFSGNLSVTWGVTGTLDVNDLSAASGSSTIFLPTSNGSGTITTSSAFADDATGTITVSVGALASLEIRTGPGGTGVVLNDTTKAAGETLTLFAAGYDANANFRQDESVDWTIEGNTIGSFGTAIPATSNVFTAETVNSARIRINTGSINDYSGIVTTVNGAPVSLEAISLTSFGGQAGGVVTDSLGVRLLDAMGNIVPDSTITWTTPTDGSLNPAVDVTDALGASRTEWTLRSSSSAGMDTAFANYPGLTSIEFTASVNPSNADSLLTVSGSGQSGTVGAALAQPFIVSVIDQNTNPVQGISVTFSITSVPSGAATYSLSTQSVLTNSSGEAQTILTLGDKNGTYIVQAFNQELLPGSRTFTSTANVDVVNALVIFSGNGQSGTVASALSNNIIVKAVDQFGNDVSGALVTWQPTTGGSIDDLAQTTTNGAGLDTVSWTLRTGSGPDTLLAILAGLDTVTYTAAASADAANSVVVLSGNNQTTVAGSNQKIEARVLDQFGNFVSGKNVSFLPASNMSALNSTSNAAGSVSAIYRAPSDQDSSIAQIVITAPADTASFKVYGIRYVSNSLSPKSVASGDMPSFTAQVNNPGPNPVLLNTANSTFVISDGTLNTTATLNTPSTLPANSATTLQFNSAVINNFASGSYTPEITLVGTGVDALMNGAITTDIGELAISPLEIDYILIPVDQDTLVNVGTTITEIQMMVTNNGINPILNVVPQLTVTPAPDINEVFTSGADNIPAGGFVVYRFSMSIPGGSPLELKTIDGSVTGTSLGDTVSVTGAAQTENFRIIVSASLAWDDYSPKTLSVGQNVSFTTDVANSGAYDVILDKNTTTLTFGAGADVFNLSSNQTLEAGATTTLTFTQAVLGITANTYVGTLVLNGTEVGNSVSSTITTTTASLSDLTVQTVASLGFVSQTLSSGSVSQGQTGETFTIGITNNGQASFKINSPDSIVVFVDGTEISALSSDYSSALTSHLTSDFPITVANLATVNFIYTVNVTDGAATGTDVFSSRIAATDLNSFVTTRSTSATNPSWDVQSKSALSITSLSATDTEVDQGQSGLIVDVTIQNSGQVSANVDTVYLDFLRNINSFIHNATFPITLAGSSSQAIQFTVTIDNNALTGVDSIRAIASGQNNNTSEILNETSIYFDSWDVLSSNALEVVSVLPDRDSVSTGQQDVPVVVTIRNSGSTSAQIDSIGLSISKGSYDSLYVLPAAVLTSGQTAQYTINVDVLSGSVSGIAILDASVYGIDLGNSQPISASSDSTAGWLIQKAVDITITDNSPLQVSTNQGFVTKLTVVNSGEARLVIDTSATQLYPKNTPGNFAKLADTSATVIEGNQTVELIFNISNSASAFVDSLKLELVGIENNDVYNNILTAPEEFIVQSQATMSVVSTDAVADSVSHGQTEQVTILINNAAQAGLVVDSLIISEYGTLSDLSPALPFTIDGATQQAFIANINVDNSTSTGDITLNVSGFGHDFNNISAIVNDASTNSPDSWFVTSAPVIVVSKIISLDTIVTQGQNSLLVDVTIRNDGQTPVLVTNLNILPRIGLYTQSWPAFNFRIEGNDSTTITDTMNIASNSATGTDSLFVQVDYQNIYSGSAGQLTSAEFHRWSITGIPTVNIVSVETEPSVVSQGQSSIDVQVRIENTGTSPAEIDSVNLSFKNGNSNYTFGVPSPALPYTLNSGLDRVFIIPVTINNNAQTGTDSIFARLDVTESVSQLKFVVTDTRINDSWEVQVRPRVTIDSVSIDRAQASTGQSGLTASVYVSNNDTVNVNRAPAQIDSVRLVMFLASVERNDQFSIDRTLIPSIPLILQQGINARFDFDIDVNTNALTGVYSVDAYMESQDINDGQQSINIGAGQAGQLLVQNAAVLAVDTVLVVPDSISQGQAQGRIYVQVSNSGQAAATINGSSLNFTPGLTDLQELFIGPATPFTLSGGSIDTLVYSFVASESFSGIVVVDATANGKDDNSGIILIAAAPNPAPFLIQTPASPKITESTPNSSPGDQNEQFRVKVFNSGETAILLDPDSTTLNINSFFKIPLDPSSATIIAAAPDTTELIFTDTFLTGLAPKGYNLTVRLKGTANKADYDNTLNAGSFAYGSGLIVVTDIEFVTSSTVSQGTTDNMVNVLVTNSSSVLSIDSLDTKLIFTLNGNEKFTQNLRRRSTDTLTVLPLGESKLQFIFDIQNTYSIGVTNVSAQLSFDGGVILVDSTVSEPMTVQSSASAIFVNSAPDSIINQQNVSFQLSFENDGTAGLALNPDSSYIEFPGFIGTPRANLAGNFTLAGGSAITTVTFSEIIVPENEPTGKYDITWHLKGTMLNGEVYENTRTEIEVFEIIPSANLIFNPIVIADNQALRGQDSVQIDYTVQNTGASDAIVNGMDFDFINGGSSVKSQWVNVSAGQFPDTIAANSSNVFSTYFNVAQDADTGIVVPAPSVNFRDIRAQHIAKTSSSIGTNDQIEVIFPATIRVDSLYFASAGNTPNAPLVNDGQSFILAVSLTNSGAVSVASGLAILRKGATNVDTVSVSNLGAGNTTTLTFKKDSISTIPSSDPVYSITLESVVDPDGNVVSTKQPLDNSETVIVQNHRTLSINSNTADLSATQNQVFRIDANIAQSGESLYLPGSIKLVLPNGNYVFANGSTQNKTITTETLSAFWDVRAINTSSGADVLRIQFASVPLDVNTGNPVAVIIDEAQVLVTVEDQGSIFVNSFVNSGPVANRDTVSTGQQFELRAQISLNKMLQDTVATLNLPQGRGYSVIGASAIAVTGEFVSWQVIAPEQLPGQGANIDTFSVSVSGDDPNTGVTVSTISTDLLIYLEQRATLSLTSNIISPQGATDAIVSTEQSFILQTQVSNTGHAAFDVSGSVLLEMHGGLLFEENNDSSLVLNGFTTTAVNKTVIVPAGSGSATITASVQNIPNDENSIAPVLVKVDVAENTLQIRKKATLKLRLGKTGSLSNQITRATRQEFQIQALIRNNGVVGVDTSGGRHFLVLDTTGTGIQLIVGEPKRKPFKIDTTVTWNVSGSETEGLIKFFVFAEPNKHPLDENENISAFREIGSALDSLSINFINVDDIVLDAKFKNGFDSIVVAINQEEIFVEANIIFDPQMDFDKKVELFLPQDAGYSIQVGNLLTNIEPDTLSKRVTWMIKAPELTSLQTDSVTIRVFGSSTQGFDKTTEQKLAITTVAIARLELQLSIDKPDGAADGEVSEGQAFRLKGVIVNRESSSPVSGNGEVRITNIDTQFFTLFDTTDSGLNIDASLTRVFKVDSAFYWWIRATAETPLLASTLINAKSKQILKAGFGRLDEVAELSLEQKKAERNHLEKIIRNFNKARSAGSNIVVTITSVPNDSRLDTVAVVEDFTEEQNVQVIKAASIKIASTSLPEKVSTGQVFTYTVTAGERSDNLISPQAQFILPVSFASENPLTILTPVDEISGTASININVPSDYSGQSKDSLKVFLFGIDENKNAESAPSLIKSDEIEIQIRPDIVLNSRRLKPVSAVDKRKLSFGQELEIKVWADFAENTSSLAYADIEGEGTITLDTGQIFEDGFSLIPGENAAKSFSALGEANALTWKIIAPQKETTSSIIFNFTSKPNDANSGNEVASSDPGETHSIQVRQKEIMLVSLSDSLASTSFIQGATDLVLFAFDISNKGYGDSLFVDSLSVSFHKTGSDPTTSDFIENASLEKLFLKLKVVNYDYVLEVLGKTSGVNSAEIFANINVGVSSENPFAMRFDKKLSIAPDSTERILVLADFKTDALIQSFRTKLEDITIFDVADSIKLLAISENGQDFIGSSEAVSGKQIVISSDFDKSFYVYPNPFGRGDTKDEREAFFNVNVAQTSEVTISVYTLLGELVWKSQTKTLTKGIYSREFRWDGKNDNGKRVLNGAYIGVLEVKPTGSGSMKRSVIKIAYIK